MSHKPHAAALMLAWRRGYLSEPRMSDSTIMQAWDRLPETNKQICIDAANEIRNAPILQEAESDES